MNKKVAHNKCAVTSLPVTLQKSIAVSFIAVSFSLRHFYFHRIVNGMHLLNCLKYPEMFKIYVLATHESETGVRDKRVEKRERERERDGRAGREGDNEGLNGKDLFFVKHLLFRQHPTTFPSDFNLIT